VDSLGDKRRAILLGTIGTGMAALLLVLSPTEASVYLAEALHGLASSLIAPAIAATSLALVGRAAFSRRLGRNARFASIGNGLTAGAMGLAGSFVSPASVYWLTAILCVPTLISVYAIPKRRRALPQAKKCSTATVNADGLAKLFMDRRLLVFAVCMVLFYVSSSAMLPLAATEVTKRDPAFADAILAVTILLPQAIVALISPWVGRTADQRGRRRIMLLAAVLLPVQGVLYATLPGAFALIVCQGLSGVSSAIFGVVMTLVVADLTRGTGRFNLMLGVLGVAISIGASASFAMSGVAAEVFGGRVAFLGLAFAGLCGTLLLWLAMPETGGDVAAAAPETDRDKCTEFDESVSSRSWGVRQG
jgi:MFS family permease